MNSFPHISVVVPVKDGELYLAEAIQSILDQTYDDFELIIIDDHSCDRTESICLELQQKDTRVRLAKNQGKGLVQALNTGIGMVRGEYVARMDADDIAHPKRFEMQLERFAQEPNCDVVGTFMRIFGWSKTAGFSDNASTEICFPVAHNDMVEALKSVGNFWVLSHPTVMMKTEAIRSVGGYRDRYPRAEDLDLWVRLVLTGKRLGNVPEFLLDYRASESSITAIGRLERYLSTAVLIGYVRDGAMCAETKISDPLSIETLEQYGESKTAFERISDFAILLRGIGHEERSRCYADLKNRYLERFENFADRLLVKANDPSSWPFEIDSAVTDDVRKIFTKIS